MRKRWKAFSARKEELEVSKQVSHKERAKKKACQGHRVFLRERRFQNARRTHDRSAY